MNGNLEPCVSFFVLPYLANTSSTGVIRIRSAVSDSFRAPIILFANLRVLLSPLPRSTHSERASMFNSFRRRAKARVTVMPAAALDLPSLEAISSTE